MKAPIILAIDTSDFDTAIAWIQDTKDSVSVYKLGLEFYLNFGSVQLLLFILFKTILKGVFAKNERFPRKIIDSDRY